MASLPNDPHTIARPELVQIINMHLGLTDLELVCIDLVEGWIKWDGSSNLPFIFLDLKFSPDMQKIVFLNLLYDSHATLTVVKLEAMLKLYRFENEDKNDEIRLAWLSLCIKSRWEEKVPEALKYAIQFSSSKYTFSIFKDLFEWPEKRVLSKESYLNSRNKMLRSTQNKLEGILHL